MRKCITVMSDYEATTADIEHLTEAGFSVDVANHKVYGLSEDFDDWKFNMTEANDRKILSEFQSDIFKKFSTFDYETE